MTSLTQRTLLSSIHVGQRTIGPDEPVWVIAEAGVNHNGDAELALQLIRAAAECGADAVKFQMFKAEDVVTAAAPKARYQLETTDPEQSQFEMLKELELPWNVYPVLVAEAARHGLAFLCTCYSSDEVDYLDELGVPAFKFASALIIELPLIRHAAAKQKPVLLSTGMATLAEVAAGVTAVQEQGAPVALFQCTTDYPADPADANLRAIRLMQDEFGVPVGYSDHTVGDATMLAAIALGAKLVEKHFTLDRTMRGPDHASSLDVEQFRRMVHRVREVEASLGSAAKEPTPRELENAAGMRRSLVVIRDLPAGAVVTADAIAAKRPTGGLPPDAADRVIGMRARVNITADTQLTFDLLDGE